MSGGRAPTREERSTHNAELVFPRSAAKQVEPRGRILKECGGVIKLDDAAGIDWNNVDPRS